MSINYKHSNNESNQKPKRKLESTHSKNRSMNPRVSIGDRQSIHNDNSQLSNQKSKSDSKKRRNRFKRTTSSGGSGGAAGYQDPGSKFINLNRSFHDKDNNNRPERKINQQATSNSRPCRANTRDQQRSMGKSKKENSGQKSYQFESKYDGYNINLNSELLTDDKATFAYIKTNPVDLQNNTSQMRQSGGLNLLEKFSPGDSQKNLEAVQSNKAQLLQMELLENAIKQINASSYRNNQENQLKQMDIINNIYGKRSKKNKNRTSPKN